MPARLAHGQVLLAHARRTGPASPSRRTRRAWRRPRRGASYSGVRRSAGGAEVTAAQASASTRPGRGRDTDVAADLQRHAELDLTVARNDRARSAGVDRRRMISGLGEATATLRPTLPNPTQIGAAYPSARSARSAGRSYADERTRHGSDPLGDDRRDDRLRGQARASTLLLQLSDPHLRLAEVEPETRLARAVAAAARAAAETARGPAERRRRRRPAPRSTPSAPDRRASWDPDPRGSGNHDDRDLLATEFAGRASATGEPVHVLAYVGALRLVGSTRRFRTARRTLEPAQLEWLEDALGRACAADAAGAAPPAVASGILAMDAMGCAGRRAGSSRCSTRIRRSWRHLRARAPDRDVAFGGARCCICPSTNSTLRLDLRPRRGSRSPSTSSRSASPCTCSWTDGSSRTCRRSRAGSTDRLQARARRAEQAWRAAAGGEL